MADKLMSFVKQPLNHVFLGLSIIALAKLLPQILMSPNWELSGYVLVAIGSVWLVYKSIKGR